MAKQYKATNTENRFFYMYMHGRCWHAVRSSFQLAPHLFLFTCFFLFLLVFHFSRWSCAKTYYSNQIWFMCHSCVQWNIFSCTSAWWTTFIENYTTRYFHWHKQLKRVIKDQTWILWDLNHTQMDKKRDREMSCCGFDESHLFCWHIQY